MTVDRSHPLALEDDDTYDTFAILDSSFGAGQVTSIYPAYAELRAECPVHPASELFARLGIDDSSGLAHVGGGQAVYTYRGVDQALRDHDGFSASVYGESSGVLMGRTILEMDEPEHLRVRRLVAEAFTPKAMATWRQTVVVPVVDRHIATFANRGRADLVSEFTFSYPVHVIAGMLGLPDEDIPLFHRRAVELFIVDDVAHGLRASKVFAEYITRFIAVRRAEPRDDIISLLAHARLDGAALDDLEIINFCRLLLPAGAETTFRSTSNLLFALLHHPEQLAAVISDRALLPQAIEEGLRWETPVTGISRVAVQDRTIDGVRIAAGTKLDVCLAATNRDPARFERPDEFDIFRTPRPHFAFGFGTHICIGAHLARMEMTVALNALFDRLPGLRLDPDVEPVEVEGLGFRSPPRLPVVWDAHDRAH